MNQINNNIQSLDNNTINDTVIDNQTLVNNQSSESADIQLSTKEILDKEYENYKILDNLDVNNKPKEGDVVLQSKLTNIKGNYFKASPEVEKEILKLVKEDYYRAIDEAPDHLKQLMRDYEPWCYYEDIKNNNCFRVSNIDELEVQEGKFVSTLHCFKVGSGQVDELIGVSPKFIRKVNAWKRSQINMISQCKIPEAFIRPLGYLLLQEMSKESNVDSDLEGVNGYKTENKIINKPQLTYTNQ